MDIFNVIGLSRENLIGYAAAFCTTVAFLPQAWVAIKTRDTQSLSLLMYVVFTAGVGLWLLYGLMKNDWALILANGITAIFSLTILITKLRYDVLDMR